MRNILGEVGYSKFTTALTAYKSGGFKVLAEHLGDIYNMNRSLRILMPGLRAYIKDKDKMSFELFWQKLM